MTYEFGPFAEVFQTDNGAEIWKFLNREDTFIRLEVATYLDRPAIEPLSPSLEVAFPQQVGVDRVRQMMGHMVRQVMEGNGYRLTDTDVEIKSARNIFKTAALYSKNS